MSVSELHSVESQNGRKIGMALVRSGRASIHVLTRYLSGGSKNYHVNSPSGYKSRPRFDHAHLECKSQALRLCQPAPFQTSGKESNVITRSNNGHSSWISRSLHRIQQDFINAYSKASFSRTLQSVGLFADESINDRFRTGEELYSACREAAVPAQRL
jgi:hypothetical protein